MKQSPKEKAVELVDKMLLAQDETLRWLPDAKQCALIAVDEMIIQNGELYLNSLGEKTIEFYKKQNAYLFDVKQEIQKS